MYYNAGLNRVTVANYTSAGIVTIETNGGIAAATFNADQTTTFASGITAQQSKFWDGTQGLFIGAFSGGAGFGALYPSTVTPSSSNHSFAASSGATILNTGTSGVIDLEINTTSALYIANSRNVLVGTTTDVGKKLTVAGEMSSYNASNNYGSINTNTVGGNLVLTGNASNNSVGGGSYIQIGDATNVRYWAMQQGASYDFRLFHYSGGSWGAVGSFAAATGIYTPLSDINKKKDFENSTIGLNAILGLKPTLYRMKSEDNTQKHLGFIAQEVKEYIPQAYVENEDFIGLNDRPIIAALVKAIQELNEKLIRNNIN